jgi:hypothetical protein
MVLVSPEEREIARLINNMTADIKENDDVSIIVPSYNFENIKFLTLKHAASLRELVTMTPEYRKNLEKIIKKQQDGYSDDVTPLFFNQTLMKSAYEDKSIVYVKTLLDIKNKISTGMAIETIIPFPKRSMLFFIKYPECDGDLFFANIDYYKFDYYNLPCDLLIENLNMSFVYGKGGYELYVFSANSSTSTRIYECEQLKDHERDWCYANKAILAGDKELCDSASDREIYHYCMSIFDGDVGHCDFIEDAELKEMCLGRWR